MRAARSFLPALLLAGAFLAGARKGDPKPPAAVADALAEGRTDRMAAIAALEGRAAELPATAPEAAWWRLAAGEQRRLAGDAGVARQWFTQVVEQHPTHPAKAAAQLGLALVNAEDGLSGNEAASLQLLAEKGALDTQNADRFRLLARDAQDSGSSPAKVKEYALKALSFAAADPAVEARVRRDLSPLLPPPPADAPPPPDGKGAEESAVDRVRAALDGRRFDEVARLGDSFLSAWPDSPWAAEVRFAQKRAAAGDPATAGRVGVLLPLTGEYAPAGKRIQQAIQLANSRTGNKLDLVFEDAAGDGPALVARMERLVLEKGVVAFLGPVLKENVLDAARAAQVMRVPLVALSQGQDPAAAGPWAFRGFVSVEQQVDALVAHAMGQRGFQRFAIVHPESAYGDATRAAFVAAVEKRGGTVARVVSYPEDARDHLAAARRLGLKDPKAQAAELGRLRREAAAKGADPAKVVLPPSIDFDAIFIPDGWRKVALVAGALAYEEFPIGTFRPHRGATALPLLGLAGWNDPGLIDAGGQYVQNSIFVDAFSIHDDAPGAQSFVTVYEDAHGRAPGVVDALAYDTARLLSLAATLAGPDREALRRALSDVSLSDPAAGGRRFGPNREIERNMVVLTISGTRIREWTGEPAVP